MSRPLMVTRPTATTISTTTASNSYTSSDYHSHTSTALTSPDLASPRKAQGRLDPMLEVVEDSTLAPLQIPQPKDMFSPTVDRSFPSPPSRYRSPGPGSAPTDKTTPDDLMRGPSVRDRASRYEVTSQASGSGSRPLPTPSPTRGVDIPAANPQGLWTTYRSWTPTDSLDPECPQSTGAEPRSVFRRRADIWLACSSPSFFLSLCCAIVTFPVRH